MYNDCYGLDDLARCKRFFVFSKMSRLALRPTHFVFSRYQGPLSLHVQRPRHGDEHPPPSSAEVKNDITAPVVYLCDVYKGNFSFLLPFRYLNISAINADYF
jgi:hypothetical protein